MVTASNPALAPLGAGDLIDRAVRLYRRHFMTLVRASAPPVVVSAIGWVAITIGLRSAWATESGAAAAAYIVLIVAGLILWVSGYFLQLIVMGGASRNLVAHLLWNERVSAGAVYRSVRARFWSLLGASFIVALWVSFAGTIVLAALWVTLTIAVIVSFVSAMTFPSWFAAMLSIITAGAVVLGGMFLFFLLVGRVAYVPQVIMVEGQNVSAAIGRSFNLARGHVRRLAAMFLFTSFAAYSALMLLLVPLGWYGYLHGINPSPFNADEWPAWYAIGYEVLAQLSSIFLAPVWMLGLSLLYVDERVRHEGYDIELMAARAFGEMPDLPDGMLAPLAPALASAETPPRPSLYAPQPQPHGSILGLR
jgi:hypothetical protein